MVHPSTGQMVTPHVISQEESCINVSSKITIL